MRTIFFTICDSTLQKGLPNSRNLDFKGFMSSFKRFHPEIEMIIFDEMDMKLHNVNYYNAKAVFGKILSGSYDLVVNVDADHLFFDRCEEILSADYDVACPANFNATNNLVGIKVGSGITGEGKPNWIVSEEEFLQGGLIASTSKQFWNHYEYASRKYYDRFVCFENDILNLVAYLYPYKLKILDGHFDYRNKEHKRFYGCSIYPNEQSCYIENDKIMCAGKPVKMYHFAHGGGKKKYSEVFNSEVSNFIKSNIV